VTPNASVGSVVPIDPAPVELTIILTRLEKYDFYKNVQQKNPFLFLHREIQ
jgi:hypothetical protein